MYDKEGEINKMIITPAHQYNIEPYPLNRKPSKKQTQRILEGVRQIGKELSEVHILM